jgi:hypothetical protein
MDERQLSLISGRHPSQGATPFRVAPLAFAKMLFLQIDKKSF